MSHRHALFTGLFAVLIGGIEPALAQVNRVNIEGPSTLPGAQVGVDYSFTLQGAGGRQPYVWAVISGALPTGLALTGGVIGGRPTLAGQSTFLVAVMDSEGLTNSKTLTITVAPAAAQPATITTSSFPAGIVGAPYSQTLAATGGTAPYTWSIASGSLPPGVSLAGSGVISGMPTTAGAYSFTAMVTDSTNLSASRALQITINPAPIPPSITTGSLPSGTAGSAYTQTLAATGGNPPYVWSVASGSLPPGLTLAGSGAISGTSTTAGAYSFTAMVTDSTNLSASRALQITINPAPTPPTITTGSLPSGTAGTAYTQALAATGGTPPYAWSVASGSLPPGLALAGSGAISGTPTTAGAYNFTAKVTDSINLSASQALQITINAAPTPPSITSGTFPSGTVSTAYSQTLAASGGTPPYVWSLADGSLPPGLTLAGSGVISGTPTTTGTFNFNARVTDSANLSATRALQIAIIAAPTPPSISTTSLPSGTAGTAYSQTLAASGGASPYIWAVTSGSLPPGLTLAANGAISGTPTTAGPYDFTARVTDASSLSDSRALRITINPAATPPSITTGSLPTASAGTAYSQTLAATGGTPPFTWSVDSGSLPPGLTLAGGGAISGTPTTAGAYDFTAKVTDSINLSGSKALRITVVAPLSITTNTLPGAIVGAAYNATTAASGGQTPYTWSVASGALPAGLTLQPSTGQLTGTLTTAGTASFSLRVTDAGGRTADKALTIAVVAAISISACPVATGLTGTAYTSSITVGGGMAPYTWSASGQLPAGLALNSSTGTLAGTPISSGAFTFTLQVSDAVNQNSTRACTVTITAALTISTPNLPDATTRANYLQSLTASGGAPPYRWATSAGSLPPGLSVDGNSGIVSGSPTQPGRFTFTVNVTDSAGAQAQHDYTIAVVAGLTIAMCPVPAASVGSQYSSTLGAVGGQTPYSWVISAGALPAGLSIGKDSGTITGIPTTAGTSSFSLQVNDNSGMTATRPCSIAVAPQLLITTTAPAGAAVGVPYADTIAATGGTPPYLWTLSGGALPPGLTANATTGGISGLPSQAGSFPFTIRVTDAAGIAAEKNLTLAVGAGFSISACPVPAATAGQPYSSALTIAGGEQPITWMIASGSLPAGLTLDTANGTITGTPAQIGSSDFTAKASDKNALSTMRTCSIIVSAAGLTITSAASLAEAVLGTAYNQGLAASGGRAPYAWTLADGSLPAGVSLTADGALQGTPTAPGTFQFTVRVTDQDKSAATQVFTLRVLPAPAPSITFNTLPDIMAPAQQPGIGFTLDNAYPVALTGKLSAQFTPDPGLNVDDKSIQFVTGGRSVTFNIPANTKQPVFPVPQLALQTGTVAGTIDLTLQLTAGNLDVTPSAAPRKSIRIDRTAPIITSMKVTPVTNGFELAVTGFSTTREVSAATFQFTPAAGSSLVSSQVSVSTADAARQWYADARSADFGSQFTFTQPFTVNGATLSEVSVALTNGQGTSQPTRAKF